MPDFNETLRGLTAPRGRNRITYDLAGEIWTVILQRLGISVSARDWDNVKYNEVLRENINILSECSANVLEAEGKFEFSKGRAARFAYVTSRKIKKEKSLDILCAGRARWSMETGNNVQKHSELNLESPYGMRGNTSLSYCMAVMVASRVRCLMEKTNYFEKILLQESTGGTTGKVTGAFKRAYNSTMAFMRAVCDSLRNHRLNLDVLPAGVHAVFSSA